MTTIASVRCAGPGARFTTDCVKSGTPFRIVAIPLVVLVAYGAWILSVG